MPSRFSRRRFLGVTGGAAAAVALGVPGELSWPGAVAAATPGSDPLARLGRAYLSIAPDEGSVDTLFDRVPGLRRNRPVIEQLPDLQSRVASDFARQRTVSIDGWRLARTEARVAALHALGQ
ncbi:MAG: hypothetical protein EXQ79_07760 [Acidimicrobiia bacterium]|nr:hypothetical protein [Acidimicrobiia bacterium]